VVSVRTPETSRRRLKPEDRARQILLGAIQFFAEQGFSGQTRELTVRLGISNGLLYRYFPSKDALIDSIYEEVFLARWRPAWIDIIRDRRQPLKSRLTEFYLDYSKMLREYQWVRIYLFAGLAGSSINRRYANLVLNQIYRPVIDELRIEFALPDLKCQAETPQELEMMWALHGALFYIGVRMWVYDSRVAADLDKTVMHLIEGLYTSAREVMSQGFCRDKPKGSKLGRRSRIRRSR
jgi:AcrR family transcriptional regulator